MFNAEWKKKFIRQYTKNLKKAASCESTFNFFEQFENGWEADLCTRSTDELQAAVNELGGVRARGISVRLTMLREYVKWCMKEGYPGTSDGIFKVQHGGVDLLKTRMVANPRHLKRYLDDMYDPENEETIDNIYRGYTWLAFSGLKEEDILNVTSLDLDLKNMVVSYGEKEYEIYKDSIACLSNCASLTQFKYKHPNYNHDIYRDRAPGDMLLRGIKAASGLSAFRARISKNSREALKTGKTDMELSYYRLWLSGLFYRMYEDEVAGFPVDFTPAAEEFTSGKVYKLDSGRNTRKSVIRKIAKNFNEDYNRWKLAFYS